MTALDTLNAARRAWEKSQPQLFIDFNALAETTTTTSAPGTPSNEEGTGTSCSGGHVASRGARLRQQHPTP